MGHVLMENRNGLVVDTRVTAAKGYDTTDFVTQCRWWNATAHVTQKKRGSGIDGRTTRHEGYRISLKVRKRVEGVFGWLKTIGWLGKLHHRGCERVDAVFTLATTAYILIRIRNLTATS